MTNSILQTSDVSQDIAALKMQLAASLKFHHSQTLEHLPLETSVRVMAEVWDTCNH